MKPTNFWKCKENQMLYQRKVTVPWAIRVHPHS